MQGLEIGGSGPGGGGAPTSPYTMDMDVGDMDAGELTFDHLDHSMPSPPQDNNQVAAWYDTDL
jgi:catenin beta 1